MAMKVYTQAEIEDEFIGKVGTPERDRYEKELAEELHALVQPLHSIRRGNFSL